MKIKRILFVLAAAVAVAEKRPARHYSYTGSDPGQWTSSVIRQGTPRGSQAGYTTFLSGAGEYRPARILTDAAGNTYVAGSRFFEMFPSASAGQLSDVFVTKLDPSGAVLFTVTMGGKGSDQAGGLALDPTGNIYLAGSTSSPNFPLRNALQGQPADRTGLLDRTGFLVKLSADGSRLLYSTYFGGTRGPSAISAVAADANGNAYVTGSTNAADFPHTEGLPSYRLSAGTFGVPGAFVTKISAGGDRVLYSAIIAGNSVSCGCCSSCFLSARFTGGAGIALDAAGSAHIVGYSNTTDLPTTPGAFLAGGIGAFAAKVNAAGSALVYLTYIGRTNYVVSPYGNPANTVSALAVDRAGNAYLAGRTLDPRFPSTRGAYQAVFSGPAEPPAFPPWPLADAFVAKLSPDGASMTWATYLGGPGEDWARDVALDLAGNVWIVGTSESPDFPNVNGWSAGTDFVVGLNSSGSALRYSARFPTDTISRAVAVDSAGLIHVAGMNGLVSALAPNQPASSLIGGIANAAGGPVSGRIAPGEAISIYGTRLGPTTSASATLDSSGRISTALSGVQVLFDNVAAPLLYVSSNQVNAMVPFGLANQSSARVRLSFDGATSQDFPAAVVPTAPEIFRSAVDVAAAVNEDGSRNSVNRPARFGSVVAIWATGTGAIQAGDGEIATFAENYRCCEVQVGSQPAEVLYAGASPGMVVGVTQINFRIPLARLAFGPGGAARLRLTARGRSSTQAVIYVAE